MRYIGSDNISKSRSSDDEVTETEASKNLSRRVHTKTTRSGGKTRTGHCTSEANRLHQTDDTVLESLVVISFGFFTCVELLIAGVAACDCCLHDGPRKIGKWVIQIVMINGELTNY